MIDDVVLLRLISGDEIICVLLNDLTSDTVKVQYPYQIRYSPKAGEVLMVPFCVLSDETYFEFKRDQILFCVDPVLGIVENYLEVIDKPETITIEEIKSKLEELGKALGISESEDIKPIVIKGTETKH